VADTPAAAEDPRRRFLRKSGWLDRNWYLDHAVVPVPPGTDLIDHYLTHGAPAGLAPNPGIAALQDSHAMPGGDRPEKGRMDPPDEDDPQLLLEMELIRESGLFDPHFYVEGNPQSVPDDVDPLLDFCRVGWRSLLRPRADFEMWWYWTNHLDPGSEAINPFVHYLLLGRAAGHATVPASTRATTTAALPRDRAVRRVCLFAGYDAEGLIDDYVVDYVRELSRFADV
jgi:hypothetical protein